MIHEFLDLYELQLIQSRDFPMPIMNLSTHPVLNEDQLSKKDFLQSLRCRHDQLVRFFCVRVSQSSKEAIVEKCHQSCHRSHIHTVFLPPLHENLSRSQAFVFSNE